ncbi:MAG: o-succinylbenzoate synthase [Anaerolineales bacterium]|nr:o-succinylbenzoate synthase [Anaerolineales bacterium]MCS7246866.1 o-succinylbenzoate synthase [Anaerolineales bacterium]MDW8160676.1 o-succinylbenzoate synthase [Anaerolineales bacterium]MDW8446907.1 o-succinylbenzoate synthase [Anaerolineales bacterium]
MRIEEIEVVHLRMPLRTPFETSFGRSVTRDCLLLIVRAEGLEGYGECVADWEPGYSPETVGTEWHILREFILPAVVGIEFEQPQEFCQKVAWIRGHRMAKAGVEMALWDLYGKRHGQSLRALLGGVRNRVEVGVSVGIQETPQVLVKVVESYLNQGYRRIKLKIKPGRDIDDVLAVRQAFPTLRLQVDANSAYTLEGAQALKPLDDLNLLLIEQPLGEEDWWGHRSLQLDFRTPICLDESILSLQHARQALEIGACRVINIKAGRVGGLTEAVAIHNHCLSLAVPVWCGGMLETGVGRASNLALASLPGFTLPGDISATERYYEEDITEERFTLNPDSTIDVPERPGLGVKLDQKALKKYQVNVFSSRDLVK